MRRPISVLGVIAILLAVAAMPASAASPSPTDPAGPPSRILGVVPTLAQAKAGGLGIFSSNLSYHKGPVEHTNTVYAIYWFPNGSTCLPTGCTNSGDYQSLINGFFTNVAADSSTGGTAKTSNVYYSDTQYYDNANGHILYSSSYSSSLGSFVDTNALPRSGCSDSATPAACLTDGQIQTEINRVIAAQQKSLPGTWVPSSSTEFFMFTAKGIGSCYGSSCSFTQFCAYHSWMGSGSTATLYANMPYADTDPAACDAGQSPNNSEADATINVTSHEHNETITDEQGSAWYDRRGSENGDKCAWNFGKIISSTGGPDTKTEYNQLIGTGKYFLQQEWSNKTTGCVLNGL